MWNHAAKGLAIVALAAAAPAPLQAQVAIELNALLGYYQPLGQFDGSTVIAAGLPVRPSDLKGAAVGGEARLWLSPRWGVQVQASTVSSTTPEVATPGGCCQPMPVRVSAFAAQAVYDVLRHVRPARLWLGAGPAVVRHGGDGYARFGSPLSMGGSVVGGMSVRLAGGLRASADAAALLYRYRVEAPGDWGPAVQGSVQSGFRKDLLLSVGLGWGLP